MRVWRTDPIFEDSGATLRNRIQDSTGSYINQASISSIALKVYNKLDMSNTVATASPVVATCIYNSLQTWSFDTTGWNFQYLTLASQVTDAGEYRYEFKFIPASGENFFVLWDVPVISVGTS